MTLSGSRTSSVLVLATLLGVPLGALPTEGLGSRRWHFQGTTGSDESEAPRGNQGSGDVRKPLDRHKNTRGWLGVVIHPVTETIARAYGLPGAQGAMISTVTPSGPAEAGGLKSDDLILAIDGHKIDGPGDLSSLVASRPPGTRVKVEVLRDTKKLTFPVRLGAFPEDPATAQPSK